MNPTELRSRFERERLAREKRDCKSSLYTFAKRAWEHVDTSQYLDNWHIGVKCEYLEALYRGEILRLAINEPPGCMKSLLTAVMFPPWVWAQDATRRFYSGSYEQTLAKRHAGKAKALMQHPWYQNLFGDIIDDGGSDSDYYTKAGGWMFAFGMGSFITGRHPDYHIIDDPTDPHVVNVDNLVKAIEWRKSKLSTRRRDPSQLRQLLIMQRVHDLDMAAYCVENEGFHVLRFPMRRTYAIVSSLPNGVDPDPRKEGELLWPERYPETTVKQFEDVELGPDNAAAQFQQDPVPIGGAIFTKEDTSNLFGLAAKPHSRQGFWLTSSDFAFKDKQQNDFVAIQVWCCLWPKFFLMHREHGHWGFVDSLAKLKSVIAMYPWIHTHLVEDKANGSAIIDSLKSSVPGLVAVDPQVLGPDKVARAQAVQGFFRAGNVWVYEGLLGLAEWQKEMRRFPKAPHDDDVDATTQALNYYKRNTGLLGTAGKWGALTMASILFGLFGPLDSIFNFAEMLIRPRRIADYVHVLSRFTVKKLDQLRGGLEHLYDVA